MILNIDCIRDVLLKAEQCGIDEQLHFEELCKCLSEYSPEDLQYSCLKLKEAGYLDVITSINLGVKLAEVVEIVDITYAGHEFLNTIRDDQNWSKTKETAKKAGVLSLKALMDIGCQIAAMAIAKAIQG